jgi:hypothetical protein
MELGPSPPADERSDVGIELVETRRTNAVRETLAGTRGAIPPLVGVCSFTLTVTAHAGHFSQRKTFIEKQSINHCAESFSTLQAGFKTRREIPVREENPNHVVNEGEGEALFCEPRAVTHDQPVT